MCYVNSSISKDNALMVSSQNCTRYTRCNATNVIHHHNVGLAQAHPQCSQILLLDILLR